MCQSDTAQGAIPQNTRIYPFLLVSFAVCLLASDAIGQIENQNHKFWKLAGSDGITWNLLSEPKLPHSDNIEMSGRRVAAIISYEVDTTRTVTISRDVIYPQLRTRIKSSANRWAKYRAYLRYEYTDDLLPTIIVGDRTYEIGALDSVHIDGMIHFDHAARQGLTVRRTLFPSMTDRLFIETWRLTNVSNEAKYVDVGSTELIQRELGDNGAFVRRVSVDKTGPFVVEPGESLEFAIRFSAELNDEGPVRQTSGEALSSRRSFLNEIEKNLVLDSPDSVLNTLFRFSKIRTAESIYETAMGLVHSPGGGRYYAGVWANDQAEYSGPFFPYLGYDTGNVAALNAYRQFLNNIPEGDGNFWSSFEMEGTVTCCGGDRGDAAMIAFGASQYALASGSKEEAEEIWPLIEWSLDYSDRHKNVEGVITSDSDEMEGRIATGGANLATSSLYLGALQQSVYLARALGKRRSVRRMYERRAADLRVAIEKYFGATIDGLETYQYFDGHPYLRHWISLPLVMGIDTRKEGTLDALFTKLWTDNGVKVEHNPTLPEPDLFWDRGTLYAFRGAFKAGAANRALEKLKAYSATRLLGFHVPYVVEAWPEGNMAHLSAESALYSRIFTEGILGIVPTSFESFSMTPTIPDDWDFLRLTQVQAFGASFDISVTRQSNKLHVEVRDADKVYLSKDIVSGATVEVRL